MAQLMSIKRNLEVCPGNVNVPAIFHVSQGDKGTRIILGLVNNGQDYTIPESTTATIRGSRPDGTLFTEFAAEVETTEIKFNLPEEMTTVPGPVLCEAVMVNGSANTTATTNFILDVEPSPTNLGSLIPGTDAGVAWLIDKLTNEPINGLNGESVVDAINDSTGSGLTEDVKVALLACFEKVAWIDEDGQDYYDALHSALYPPADLVSISAVYTQSGTVYDTDSLDSLKSDLVVTAHMSDSTTQTITSYTLSGTLTAGTSTITVSYGGKTTTFNVTVTGNSYVSDGLVMWLDGEKNGVGGVHNTTLETWVDQTGNGWNWTNVGATVGEKSVVFNGNSSYRLIRDYQSVPTNVQMMEVVIKRETGGAVLTGFGRNRIGNISIASSSDLISFHTGTGSDRSSNTAFNLGMDNNIHSASSAGYLDGVQLTPTDSGADWQYEYPCIGLYRQSNGSGTANIFKGEIFCIRLYSRILTEQEILANYAVDARRFGIGGLE